MVFLHICYVKRKVKLSQENLYLGLLQVNPLVFFFLLIGLCVGKVINLVCEIFRQVTAMRVKRYSDRLVLISLSSTLGRAKMNPGPQTIAMDASLEEFAYPTCAGGKMYTSS